MEEEDGTRPYNGITFHIQTIPFSRFSTFFGQGNYKEKDNVQYFP